MLQMQAHPQQQQQKKQQKQMMRQQQEGGGGGGMKSMLMGEKGAPSASKIIALLTLLPISATLFFISFVTVALSLTGLAFAAPLFLLFSPILAPAAFALGVAVVSFLTSGALGLTGLSSLSCFADSLREATLALPGSVEQVRRKMQDVAGQTGQKTRELGHSAQAKAHDSATRA